MSFISTKNIKGDITGGITAGIVALPLALAFGIQAFGGINDPSAASMGAFLLAGGAKGKRYALPNAEIMIHQPSGGAQGQATEIQITAEHILRTKEKLNKILSANTGQPYEVVAADTERDNWKTAEEAKEYGLIDTVITSRAEVNSDGEK